MLAKMIELLVSEYGLAAVSNALGQYSTYQREALSELDGLRELAAKTHGATSKLAMIRAYRNATGVSLQSAKAHVERLMGKS